MPRVGQLIVKSGRVVGLVAVAGSLIVSTAAPAWADEPAPNCTAADLAAVLTGVSAATTAYLFTHPDVNAEFTGLKGATREQTREHLQDYLAANPQVAADLQAIRQPSEDFRNRCGADAETQASATDQP
ncbi:MAG: heme-binding protein [Mycobacterium sp.]